MMQDIPLFIVPHVHAEPGIFQEILDDGKTTGLGGQEGKGKPLIGGSLDKAGVLSG